MKANKSFGEIIFDILNIVFMLIIIIATIYPILYITFASVSDPLRLIRHTGILWAPLGFTLKGYDLVFKNPNIIIGYRNTLVYVIAGTAINLFMTSIGAYAISRKNLLWKKAIMFFIVFTMFFSGGLIPRYLLIKELGMLNKLWAMLIPCALGTWNLIIMRTSFEGIPDSLEESAKIDGANDYTILWRIILPLSLPVLAVMALFYGVGHWNSWFDAMVFLRDRKLFPLQLFLREILIQDTTDVAVMSINMDEEQIYKDLLKYSTIMIATLPILFAYPFLQKYFVKGVMVGALKG